jgi:hypothetical protein
MTAVTTRLRRVPVLVLVLAVPLLIGALNRTHATHSIVHWLCSYSPSRFVHGAIWTLPASALLEAQPSNLRLNTLVPMLIFTPYLLWVGVGPAVKTFFVGHIVATLTAASLILLGVLAGSGVANHLFTMPDNGVSAGLAATAGALGMLLWFSRARPLAAIVLGVVLVLFTSRLASERLGGQLADFEHLVAIATGALLELRRHATSSSSPSDTPIPARVAGAPRA